MKHVEFSPFTTGRGGGISGDGCHSNLTSQPFGIGLPSKQMTCAILLTSATAMGWMRDEITLGLTGNHSAVSSVSSVCNLRLSRQPVSVEISATPCLPVTNVSEEPTTSNFRAKPSQQAEAVMFLPCILEVPG
jgi:hypothetical protein